MPTSANLPGLHGGGEDEEFSDETDGEWNPGKRKHGREHREGQKRRALGEAVEMRDVVTSRMVGHYDEDEEAEERSKR